MFIVNLDKKVLDGSLFNKLLNVKNPGEWLSLTKRIINDHFTLKNKANFVVVKKKLIDICATMSRQLRLQNVQHQNFIDDFTSVIEHKFEVKTKELTDNVKMVLRSVQSHFIIIII